MDIHFWILGYHGYDFFWILGYQTIVTPAFLKGLRHMLTIHYAYEISTSSFKSNYIEISSHLIAFSNSNIEPSQPLVMI